MKISLVPNKITKSSAIAGLLSGQIEFEVKSGTSDAQWIGPKISPVVWHKILSFFKDTYDRHKSECQVRLFCNPVLNTWEAHAFPQEARTSMSARELDNPEATQQWELFKKSDGWIYLGTVHHHCGMSAFQSGTDRNNEVNQDGLHITIGNLASPKYDIHARFYFAGCEYDPDLSVFWDVGDQVRALLPEDCLDKAARHQMTLPPAVVEYPELWKTNLIEIAVPVFYHGEHAAAQNALPWNNNPMGSPSNGTHHWKSENERKRLAVDQVIKHLDQTKITEKELEIALSELLEDDVIQLLRQAAVDHRLTVFEVAEEFVWREGVQQQALEQATDGSEWADFYLK